MHSQIQPNEHLVTALTVERNPHASDLLHLNITENAGGYHASTANLVMSRALWQRLADQLAARGISPTVHGVSAHSCGHCGARFGIAGHSTGSPEDLAAEEQYRADVDFHESAACSVPPLAEVTGR